MKAFLVVRRDTGMREIEVLAALGSIEEAVSRAKNYAAGGCEIFIYRATDRVALADSAFDVQQI